MRFRTLDHERYRTAFVANNLVPMSQTIGRSIRGNQHTTVLLCDAAFAERLASGDEATRHGEDQPGRRHRRPAHQTPRPDGAGRER